MTPQRSGTPSNTPLGTPSPSAGTVPAVPISTASTPAANQSTLANAGTPSPGGESYSSDAGTSLAVSEISHTTSPFGNALSFGGASPVPHPASGTETAGGYMMAAPRAPRSAGDAGPVAAAAPGAVPTSYAEGSVDIRTLPSPSVTLPTADDRYSVPAAAPAQGPPTASHWESYQSVATSHMASSDYMSSGDTKAFDTTQKRRATRPRCVVCMAARQEIAIDPCGHLSMCHKCAASVQMCPICRGPIEKALRVFVVT